VNKFPLKPVLCSLVCIILSAVLSGCGTTSSNSPALAASANSSALPPNLVKVPNIEGLTVTEAEATLSSVGLVPADVPVYGPIEADAGAFASAYRQSPRPGSMVPRGSKVSFRWWWETS
jgi:beta-lactam-binding protein with PASTA domain